MAFKRPKIAKNIWTVKHIEKDPEKVTWTNGGITPNYIQLECTWKEHTGQVKTQTVWTCENKIRVHETYKGKS